MTISPPTEGKQFKSSLLSLFIFILVASLPATFCVAWTISSGTTHEKNAAPITPGLIVSLLVGAAVFQSGLAFIGAWLLSTFCPTAISADGVTTRSLTGGRRSVRWQDITTARTLRLLNLKWILVDAVNESKALQVPLFQPRKAEFIQEIQRFAPPSNPILNHLR